MTRHVSEPTGVKPATATAHWRRHRARYGPRFEAPPVALELLGDEPLLSMLAGLTGVDGV